MTRKEIFIDQIHELHKLSEAMSLAVFESGADVYRYAETLVKVDRGTGRAKTRPLSVEAFRHEVSKSAVCLVDRKQKDGGTFKVEVYPPQTACRDAIAGGDWPFHELVGLIRHPSITENGELIISEGYDKKTGLFVDTAGMAPNIPESPTRSEVDAARDTILEPLIDFPFTERADVANAVALFLSVLCRPMIRGAVPIFGILAPAPGTGKTLLVDALLTPITGDVPSKLTETRDSDELQKTLVAALLESPEALIIDNLNSRIDSGIIASISTTGRLKGRILGHSEVVDIPVSAPFILTANNPQASSEITRRIVPVKLSANTDKPWMRENFRHPALVEYVKENRGSLISAGLTLARAWVVAGKPKPKGKRLGSFESWVFTIGGILEFACLPGFLDNLDAFHCTADEETVRWESFAKRWQSEKGIYPVNTSELIELALHCEVIEEGRTHRGTVTALGRALGKMQDRVFSNLKIKRAGIVSGLQLWKVEELEQEV